MKIKNIITVILLCSILAGFSIYAYVKPQSVFSDSERRALAQFPELSAKTLLSGEFMKKFESYTTDQFPFREEFRKIKVFSEENLFLKMDNKKVFKADGHLSKIEYPLNHNMLDIAISRFNKIYNNCLKDASNIYFSVVPDKNYFLAEKNGYLYLDYNEMVDYITAELDYIQYIDITSTLDINDYYYTDTHWKQENLVETASVFATEMDFTLPTDYTVNTLENPFYGVYSGQYALPVEPDTIKYLTNDIINSYNVTRYNNNGKLINAHVYDMSKATSKDPYEIFLSGAVAVQTIVNPKADNNRELIVFRDSFGSSITPLLAQGYAKTTLIDIRYISADFVGAYADFENADVLFMYSPIVLNNKTFK